MDAARNDGRRKWWVLALLGVAFCFGASLPDLRDVHADSRNTVPQATAPIHLKSGAARSETILLEIANSLKRIESRLERLDKIAHRLGTSNGLDNPERSQ